MPKSCEEIRNFGVGKSDGQYVLEARKGCHLSVICQNMEDAHPKEFLGGPNRQQWEAYPFAALIKISSHDKENIQSGACLENSGTLKLKLVCASPVANFTLRIILKFYHN